MSRMQPGNQLGGGRYTLKTSLKRTGMAEVWLAEQRGGGGFSKQVVIKMIHPDLHEQREARQRFLDEARLASQIQHPHVVQVYDFGEESGMLFLAMEYIDGFDIEAIIERASELNEPVPIPIICRMMADACQGLGFIHDATDERGQPLDLVHRDISPQNLVVSVSGGIKIIDFGIVKARVKESRTRTGVIVGKLQYMSPEQLSSEDLDRRSDVFSLGLVLYELLTLQARFRGSNMLEVFYEALNEPPPAVVDLRPDCPPELVNCVKKALAQEQDDRYANAYLMQEDLEACLMRTGVPTSHRQIAAYLQQHFGDDVHSPDQTRRVDAASLLDGIGNYGGGGDIEETHSEIPKIHDADGNIKSDLFSQYSSDILGSDHTMGAGPMVSASANATDPHTMGAGPLMSPFVGDEYAPNPASPFGSSHTMQDGDDFGGLDYSAEGGDGATAVIAFPQPNQDPESATVVVDAKQARAERDAAAAYLASQRGQSMPGTATVQDGDGSTAASRAAAALERKKVARAKNPPKRKSSSSFPWALIIGLGSVAFLLGLLLVYLILNR